MAKSKKSRNKHHLTSGTFEVTPTTFAGLNIDSKGSEPTTRNVPPPTGKPYEQRQKQARETLRKTEQDMYRQVLDHVAHALANPIRLPFRVSDFVEKRNRNAIPVVGGSAFGSLSLQPRRLEVNGRSAVLVDMDDVVILWYFPTFLGRGLRENLLGSLDNLVKVYRPPTDSQIRDRRAASDVTGPCSHASSNYGISTRSQAARTAEAIKSMLDPRDYAEEPIDETCCVLEDPARTTCGQTPPEAYIESEGEVHLAEPNTKPAPSEEDTSPPQSDEGVKSQDLAKLAPFAFYFSPGWCQTGMQYLRPVQMSLHFRNALAPKSQYETVHFLESKRLFDKKVSFLTDIIHPSLSDAMRQLRTCMSAVKGVTPIAVVNGWTSAFPCFGVGVNRTTAIHRDTRGIRGGLDIIGVLGTFTAGGDLEFPDLNLKLEWKPGCLCAFDGYDFRHKVNEWSGGSRITLISFCRQSTWSALGLDSSLTRPTRADCLDHLSAATKRRAAAIEAAQQNKLLSSATRLGGQSGKKNRQGMEYDGERELKEPEGSCAWQVCLSEPKAEGPRGRKRRKF